MRDAQSIVEPSATPITLEEFTQAVVFQDPEQLENLRRIEAEEKSLFTPIGGPARQGARVTGLVEG